VKKIYFRGQVKLDKAKVHIWVGINYNEDYDEYFNLDYSDNRDIDSPDYKVCRFCKDIGVKWYDEDWISVTQGPELVDIDVLLDDDLCVTEEILSVIKKICIEKGFQMANAMFTYTNPNIIIEDMNKTYNQLSYIGAFDTDLEY